MPRPAATPSLIAALSSRPVSSAMPKRPAPSDSSTSSEVAPTSAISKSWMTAAPLVAMAETKPRSMRSITTGPRPVLITCAPRPHTTPASARLASTIARTTALKSAAARMFGSESTKAPIDVVDAEGRAKSSYENGIPLCPPSTSVSLTRSQYQHRIAVAVEAIALGDGGIIRGSDQRAAGERRHQHQQRGSRQVEVGQQAADDLKAEAGIDEEVGRAAAGDDGAVVRARNGLERPRRRRSEEHTSEL